MAFTSSGITVTPRQPRPCSRDREQRGRTARRHPELQRRRLPVARQIDHVSQHIFPHRDPAYGVLAGLQVFRPGYRAQTGGFQVPGVKP